MRGRRTQQQQSQAPLVPLAVGHAAAAQPVPTEPFGQQAPEATFSLAQVRETSNAAVSAPALVRDIAQPVRTSPPSFREIRAGRAVAAARRPVAEVRISAAELEQDPLPNLPAAQHVLPGMEQLVERVRQRTAARLSRAGGAHPA